MPHEERDIEPERLAVDRVQVLAERPPARDEPVRTQRQFDELAPGVRDRRERVAAIARQLGREPLAEVAGERAVDEQRAVRVPVRVDEPRARRRARSRRSPARRRASSTADEVVDGQDPVAEDADVGTAPGRPGPVDDGAAAQEQVEGGHAVMMPPRTGTSPDAPSSRIYPSTRPPKVARYGDLRMEPMTVEALRRRRPETLGELLETYGRELQSVAYLILRDRAEAEDVVIETLLTAFEQRRRPSATSARCARGSCASRRTRPSACDAAPAA